MAGLLFESRFEADIDGPVPTLFASAIGAARSFGAKQIIVTVSAKIRDEEPDDDGKPYGWMDQEIKMVPKVLTYDEAAVDHICNIFSDLADAMRDKADALNGIVSDLRGGEI